MVDPRESTATDISGTHAAAGQQRLSLQILQSNIEKSISGLRLYKSIQGAADDRMAVLDSQLRVLGCEGLRVMDLSSMYDIVNKLGAYF
jgi:hypothetical protein